MVFDKHVDALSRARARIIKSESLTDNMNRHGSNAAMTTTNGIRLDVAQHLASKLTRLLNRRLVHPLLDLNFGQRLVRIHISVKATEDLNQQMRIFREAHTMGVPLSLAQVRRNFNLNAPVDAADTLAQGGFNPFAGA
jgi:phage gp29-like protein